MGELYLQAEARLYDTMRMAMGVSKQCHAEDVDTIKCQHYFHNM